MEELGPIKIPEDYNYAAVFLTLACNLSCSYCINNFGLDGYEKKHLSGEDWVRGLNRIVSRDDLPLTLQGGEPSLHKDFIYILNNIRPELHIDILTNLQFDEEEFIKKVDPKRLRRNSPYASIRVSYHPEVMELLPLIEKVLKLQDAGFSIGIWGVKHPKQDAEVLRAKEICDMRGIDYRFKEFLGFYNGRLHGTYRYEGAVEGRFSKTVMCKTTELIIGSKGSIYRCHSDLYEGRPPVGNILDPNYDIENIFRTCRHFGHCNPCDLKVKTNRFQIFGHTSVEIQMLKETGVSRT
ncbi:MAG: radical SAM protein [Deltaproteobacteria bacterium]|nr:radical SAM protein [Deltaproteobacteria bacterium]